MNVNGKQKSFSAAPEIYNQISKMKLGPGDADVVRKLTVQNGNMVTAKWMLEVVSKEHLKVELSVMFSGDKLKNLLLQCLNDAASVVREAGIQFSNDEIQKLATNAFKTKNDDFTTTVSPILYYGIILNKYKTIE